MCAALQEGEMIVADLEKTGIHVSVETKTALLKGFAHSGQIAKAESLFTSMCESSRKSNTENFAMQRTKLCDMGLY